MVARARAKPQLRHQPIKEIEGTPTGFVSALHSPNAGVPTISVESIRDYVDHRLAELDLRYHERMNFTEEAQSEKWGANSQRLAGMNEIREAMKDQAGRTPSRDEVLAWIAAMRTERDGMVGPLRDKVDAQSKPNLPLIAGMIGLAFSLVSGFFVIVALKIEAQSAPLSTRIETSSAALLQLAERVKENETRAGASTAADIASALDRSILNDRVKAVESKQNNALQLNASNDLDVRGGLREIETQFRGVSNMFNVQMDYTQQMVSILYSKTFPGERLPPTNYRPQLSR